jgi:hypothetical protein
MDDLRQRSGKIHGNESALEKKLPRVSVICAFCGGYNAKIFAMS